jgi:four helix bundle protein
MGSQSYRDLIVWQKSIALCTQVYKTCEAFPKSELYGLADQLKRSAVSVPSNIAEGQGRQHIGEFLHFISVANGSSAELRKESLPKTLASYNLKQVVILAETLLKSVGCSTP